MSDKILEGFPDIFLCNDGTALQSPDQWPKRREELLNAIVPLLYGGLPPQPEVLRVSKLFHHRNFYTYLIEAGTQERLVSFELRLHLPQGEGPFPVILTGDGCFACCTEQVIQEANRRGFMVAIFNRLMIARDNYEKADYTGGIYDVYPGSRFGAIAAWAWGYHRCVDTLEQMEFADSNCIAITGHSRGGKTTLLAAATDPRILFTQDNASGACGGGCFRYEQYVSQEEMRKYNIEDPRSERLEDLYPIVPYWLGQDIWQYIGKEYQLPFDQHFLKAAIAPRWLLQTNSLDDIWANPKGSYQTHLAAKEVYRFLNVEDRIASVYRYGPHDHRFEDFYHFFDFIECAINERAYLKDNADQVMNMPFLFKQN